MASSIQRFREAITSPDGDISDLMTQASVLARVLRQKQVVDWYKKEQNGYGPKDPVPPYRQQLEGHLLAWMPASGWIQAPISDQFEHELARRDIRIGFSQVVDHLEASRKSGGERIDFSEEEMREIQRKIHHDAKLAFAMPSTAYAQITESCRAVLRLWVEDLVAAGVVGDGMKFSDDEKVRAWTLDDNITVYCTKAVEEGRKNAVAAAKRPSLLGRLLGG